MKRISERLSGIPGSATLAINTRAREMAASGQDVISFGAGEPDFATPTNVIEAAVAAAHEPAHHKYTPNPGLRPLREAVARYTSSYSDVETTPEEVIVTNGAKQAIFQAFAALLDPGDEVLMPAPHWVTYPAGIELAGGIPVSIPTGMDSGFKVSVDQLAQAKTDRTRLLIFVSPSNPTGAVYTKDEARAIGEWARDNDIWVVADEIYQRLVYDGSEVAPSIARVTDGLDNRLLINGVAKSFAMTGWRVGWMIGPPDVTEAAARYQSHATSNVNNVAQMAALEAITGPQETVTEMREHFDRRRRRMLEILGTEDRIAIYEPEGAFYVFPDVTRLLTDRYPSSAALAAAMLEEAGVAVIPGESFGSPGHIRISYALADDELERGMARMLDMFGRV